jgi:hypothetical protein
MSVFLVASILIEVAALTAALVVALYPTPRAVRR